MRTSPEELERAAIEALEVACGGVGLLVRPTTGPGPDVIVSAPDGRRWHFEVKARAVAAHHPANPVSGDGLIVVADVVTGPVADALRDRHVSWLDRRGHLRLEAPGLLIDTDVAALPRRADTSDDVPDDPFGRGRATIEVALAALLTPDDPPGIRQLAEESNLAPSTVSTARDRLQRASLVTSEGFPLIPELFWALADRWRPRWHPLASDPDERAPTTEGFLDGRWVATGELAAVVHGAPMAVGREAPSRYYLEGPSELRQAREAIGDAAPHEAACWVAVPPSRLVHTRADRDTDSMAVPWKAGPFAPPVVVALELAGDPSRGREILQNWARLRDDTAAVWHRP